MSIEVPLDLLDAARQHDLVRLRCSLFAMALLFGAAYTLLDRLVLPATGFDRGLSPAVAACLVTVAVLTLRRGRIPRNAAWAGSLCAAVYVFVKVARVLFGVGDSEDLLIEAGVFAPWGPIILIMTSALFPHGPALRTATAAYYAALLLPGVAFVASGYAPLEVAGVVESLVLASGAATAILGRLIRLQELQARDQALREAVELLGLTDPLTGLPNRQRLTEHLMREIEVARRHQWPLAVILVDLDNFRAVNDRHGYRVGDSVLVEVAKRTRECVRQTDPVGRWGGEEFLIVAPDANGAHASEIVARVRRAVDAAPFTDREVAQTASFGVAVLQAEDTSVSLLARAETALQKAKTQGGDRVAFE